MSIQCATKSRVETQFALHLPVLPAQFDTLFLPPSHCTKPSSDQLAGESVLRVEVHVQKSDGSTPSVCASCKTREVKRFQRRKSCGALPGCVGQMLVFHSAAAVPIAQDLQVRLTCYCRHHAEQSGFIIRLVFKDSGENVVLTADTLPVMITDDHKSVNPSVLGSPTSVSPALSAVSAFSPGSSSGSSVGSVISFGNSEGFGNVSTSGSFKNSDISNGIGIFGGSGVYSNADNSDKNGHIVDKNGNSGLSGNAPKNIKNSKHNSINDSIANNDLGTAKNSHSSISSIANAFTIPTHTATSAHKRRRSNSPFSPSSADINSITTSPPIERVIPSNGPIAGSTQVTLLGVNLSRFSSVSFGLLQAPIVASYGHGSVLVVLSPPASHPGPVQVYLDNVPQQLVFTYEDTTDKAILELALQVVGLGLTGRVESAHRVAMAIINSSPTGQAIHPAGRPMQDNVIALLSLLDEIPHVVNEQGHSILHLSAVMNYPHLAKHVLARGADPNAQDLSNRTPLHIAATMERHTVARLLLHAGASNDVRDKNGDTPAKLGSRMGWSQIGALISRFRRVVKAEEVDSEAGCTDEEEDDLFARLDHRATAPCTDKLAQFKKLLVNIDDTESDLSKSYPLSPHQRGRRPTDLLPTPLLYSTFSECDKHDSWLTRTESKFNTLMDRITAMTNSPPPYNAAAASTSEIISVLTDSAPNVPKSLIFRRTGDTRVLTIWAPTLVALLLWAVYHYAESLSTVIHAIKVLPRLPTVGLW